MSGSEHHPDSPISFDDDEMVWSQDSPNIDFIVLHHPFPEAHSLPSTISDVTGHPGSDDDLPPALDKPSVCDDSSFVDSSSSSTDSNSDCALFGNRTHHERGIKAESRNAQSSSDTSSSSEYLSGIGTPIASYDDASAFISRYMSSSVKGGDAELNLLRALIIELGLRAANTPDLPCTLTSARKFLKAEAYVNIKEYVATRDKGQLALRGILKPSKKALRRSIRKGNKVSLQWAKQHGLQVLLVTCFR